MGESVREQMIRLGLIKPQTDVQPQPFRPTSSSPAQSKGPSKKSPVPPAPRPPAFKEKPRSETHTGRPPSGRFNANRCLTALPGSEAWFGQIEAIERHILASSVEDARSFVNSKGFSDVINICEFLRRIQPGGPPPVSWLLSIAWDFSDIHDLLKDRDPWSSFETAKLRHKRAMIVWDITRSKERSEASYRKIFEDAAWGTMSLPWAQRAWTHGGPAELRKAEVRVAFAHYACARLRDHLGLKTRKPEPAASVWESSMTASRRFGGGRPRSERFRR